MPASKRPGPAPRDSSGAARTRTVRLTEAELAESLAAAARAGLPWATWAAQVLAEASGPPRAEAELRAEIRDLRGAVSHLHDLQLRRHEDAQIATAIRAQANVLSTPFSYGAVEERLAKMREPSR